jgi:methyltransferase (TIGR00027 family)
MSDAQAMMQNVSDTARWAAVFRARETERPDALFRDPFARRLAGTRGFEMTENLRDGNKHAWAWTARTEVIDEFLRQEIERGADMILNLAAGLDARPYRMKLPPSLLWVEADLPGILTYKEEILAGEKPTCSLERMRVDLSVRGARRDLFSKLQNRARRIVVLTEGLVIYFGREEVAALAEDLSVNESFARWIVDIHSPGLLQMMQRSSGQQLREVGAPFRFGPPEGPDFFASYGWKVGEVRGMLKTAARFGRPPFLLRLIAWLPESKGKQGRQPWSGVCLLENKKTSLASH